MHRPPFLLSITLTYTSFDNSEGGKGASYIRLNDTRKKTIWKEAERLGIEKDERGGQVLSLVKKRKKKRKKVSEFLVKFSIKRSVVDVSTIFLSPPLTT